MTLMEEESSVQVRNRLLAIGTIGLLAFLLRWFYVTHTVLDTPVRGDAIEYFCYAWNLVHHGVFSMAKPESAIVLSDSFRDPGYPVFLAGWIAMFGEYPQWYAPLFIAQAVLGAATVVLWMYAAKPWLPQRWIIVAGLLMAVWPHSMVMTRYVLSETLFGFLCALGFFALGAALRRPRTPYMALAGLVFGLAALTNAVSTPLIPIVAVLLWSLKRISARQLAVLVIAALLLPAAWSVRNASVGGRSSAERATMNLVQGSWPEYHDAFSRFTTSQDLEAKQTLDRINDEIRELRKDRSAGLSTIVTRMSADPWRHVRWYASKPAYLWGWTIGVGSGDIDVYPTPESPFRDIGVWRVLASLCHALNPLLALAMMAGCVAIAIRRRDVDVLAVALAIWALLVTGVFSVLQAEPRYSTPFRGIEFLLAAYGVWRIGALVARARLARVATA